VTKGTGLAVAAFLAATAGGIFFVVWDFSQTTSGSATGNSKPPLPQKPVLAAKVSEKVALTIPEKPVKTAPVSSQPTKAEVLERIGSLATEYEPESVPQLEPYLGSPDPEIREAALTAFIQIDQTASVPVLRAAAERATDPAEKQKLREAADFIALPPYQLTRPAPSQGN